MKNLFTLIILLLISYNSSFSQTYWLPKTQLFDFLYTLKKPITTICCNGNQEYIKIPGYKGLVSQQILKTSNNLYILIGGTGQVYKAIDTSNNKIAFTRIDSTTLIGYNYHAINFVYKDTLFSYGGYGFWRTNGQLRYLYNGIEWNIFKINKELKIDNKFFYYSDKSNSIFTLNSLNYNEIINEKADNTAYLVKLDLNKKSNEVTGIFNSKFHFTSPKYLSISSPNLNGLIIIIERDTYLFDFANNLVYKDTNDKLKIGLYDQSEKVTTIENAFELDNKIYFTTNLNDSLRSFGISMKDFVKEPYTLYTPVGSNFNYYLITIFIFIIALLIFLLIQKKKKQIKEVVDITLVSTHTDEIQFNESEKNLINIIANKSLKDETASIDEVNSALGIAKKPLEIQKRIRAQTINHINHKFKVIYEQESELISRIRMQDDKRYFKYYISKENIQIYKKTLK